jgi:hypothetical protein
MIRAGLGRAGHMAAAVAHERLRFYGTVPPGLVAEPPGEAAAVVATPRPIVNVTSRRASTSGAGSSAASSARPNATIGTRSSGCTSIHRRAATSQRSARRADHGVRCTTGRRPRPAPGRTSWRRHSRRPATRLSTLSPPLCGEPQPVPRSTVAASPPSPSRTRSLQESRVAGGAPGLGRRGRRRQGHRPGCEWLDGQRARE